MSKSKTIDVRCLIGNRDNFNEKECRKSGILFSHQSNWWKRLEHSIESRKEPIMKIMKTYSMAIFVACVFVALVLTVPAHAADEGWYLDFGAGGNMPTAEYHADPGFRLSAAGGYNFNRWLGLELETGFLYNSVKIPPINIDDITIGDIKVGDILGDISIENINIDVKQVPLLLNFMLHFKNETKWEPYAGFGMGGVYVMGSVNILLPLEESDFQFDVSGYELVYQPKIGIRRMINESMSIGVGYKFLGYGVQSVLFSTPLGNHSLMIELNKRF
jgi:opacity protein-like surface antigen